MCRIVGYLGSATSLHDVLVKPTHSLMRQARHPRELPPDMTNADGYGVAFWDGPARSGDGGPALYRSILPMWGDENLASLTPHLRGDCLVASTRSATDAMPTAVTNTAPFVRGRLAFAHNGMIAEFHRKVMRRLRDVLRDEEAACIRGNTDSEHLFALFTHLLGARAGAVALVDATHATVDLVRSWVVEAGLHAQLNFLLSDGDAIVATRFAAGQPDGKEPPSLHAIAVGTGQASIASEPFDERAGWSRVPPDTLLYIDRTTPLTWVGLGSDGAQRGSVSR